MRYIYYRHDDDGYIITKVVKGGDLHAHTKVHIPGTCQLATQKEGFPRSADSAK